MDATSGRHVPSPRTDTAPAAAENPRRGFLLSAAAAIAAGAAALVPLAVGIVAFLDPLRRKKATAKRNRGEADEGGQGWVRVCALEALGQNGPPQRFPVIADQYDAWNFTPGAPIGAVYVERTGPQSVRVFNATCPHAGCSVSFHGQGFVCPCHNSSFDLSGAKQVSLSGRENPSPRGLDSLEVDPERLAQGEVWIRFMEFYTGRAEKIPKL
jgi:menaquinol-cytochrome c reductase iron-sulfur subunit